VGSEAEEVVWCCLVVSLDRCFCFVLFHNPILCCCLLSARPSLLGVSRLSSATYTLCCCLITATGIFFLICSSFDEVIDELLFSSFTEVRVYQGLPETHGVSEMGVMGIHEFIDRVILNFFLVLNNAFSCFFLPLFSLSSLCHTMT